MVLVELLCQWGVCVDVIFIYWDVDFGMVDVCNVCLVDENEMVLVQFKCGEFDVLVNICMLIEGIDVLGVQMVFLIWQIISCILLIQMVGWVLWGLKFGGIEEVYVVFFIDDWKQYINWVCWDDLFSQEVDDQICEVVLRLFVEFVSIDFIVYFVCEFDLQDLVEVFFLILLLFGWYVVSYDVVVQFRVEVILEDENVEQVELGDDIEMVCQFILVYSQDQVSYLWMFQEFDQVWFDDFGEVEFGEVVQ